MAAAFDEDLISAARVGIHRVGSGSPGDLRVWRVIMTSGELGAEVIVDAMDRTVYSTVIGIAN